MKDDMNGFALFEFFSIAFPDVQAWAREGFEPKIKKKSISLCIARTGFCPAYTSYYTGIVISFLQ
jgi:hypothetical protein